MGSEAKSKVGGERRGRGVVKGRCWRGGNSVSWAKWKKARGESSRCCDQVFGSRVTTSTLAVEYVTARDYVG